MKRVRNDHPRSPAGRIGALGFWLAGSVLVTLLLAPTAAAQGEYEPNDSWNDAYGPIMAGETYTAGFETENDADYFFFYLPTRTQLGYQLSAPAANERRVTIDLYRADLDGGTSHESKLTVSAGSTGNGAVTLDRGKYFVTVCSGSGLGYCNSAQIGDRYSFRLEPEGATSTYEPFEVACNAARAEAQARVQEWRKAKARFRDLRSKLRRVRTRRANVPALARRATGARANRLQTRARRLGTRARKLRTRRQRAKVQRADRRVARDEAQAVLERACSVPR